MFHLSKRQKSAWKHLSEAQVWKFVEELISGLAPFSAGFVVGGVYRSEYPTGLPAEGHFPAAKMGPKQLAGMACMSALVRLNEV